MCKLIQFVAFLTLTAAEAMAGFSGSDVFLPMVGRQAGVFPSDWYATVWIHNPGAAAATARVFFLERGAANPSPPYVDILVAPGDTEKLDNVVEGYFHRQAFGALRVTCGTEKLVVTSRVYSKGVGAGQRDSVGQDFAAVPAAFAIGAGESTRLLGVWQAHTDNATSDFRYNFGAVETTGHSATVRFTAYDENNQQLGATTVTVQAFSQGQWAYKDRFPAGLTDNARLEAQVTSGAGKVIVYGSGVANGSQDPTTFEMQYRDSLLGISTVQHDATLTGEGTSGAPLGLADGAVTLGKLATTNPPSPAPQGGVAAQAITPKVLATTDGSTLSWQPAGSGGITAVNAGAGLTGGAPSGDATLAVASGGVTTSMLADGAVTDAKVASGIAYSKLSGAPPSLPPNGAAGGALTGTYPNPGISNGAVGTAQLADGAVTVGKLSATASASGQVPTSNGSVVVWQDAGLTLPFTRTVNNGSTLLWLQNSSPSGGGMTAWTNAGIGLYGNAQGGYGVAGDSSSSYGVVGSTTSSNSSVAAVYGHTGTSACGVRGVSGLGRGVSGTTTSGQGGYTAAQRREDLASSARAPLATA